MNRAWASSIENLWHSQSLPMWLTIAAAAFFAIVLLVTLFRAERSVANGALTVITLLAIGIAVTTMMRASTGAGSADSRIAVSSNASLPALACLDGLAGESVEAACEKALFASADSVAAGVSYTAAQISRLASFGNAVNANKAMTPELNALRRTVERDRYGLVAQVLKTREGCTLSAPCPFFQSLTNSAQISSNMSEDLYESFVGRYAPGWATQPAAVAVGAPSAPVAALGTVPPPGRPVSGDFPSAASIPPINIMTPEPAAQGSQAGQRPPEPGASPPPRSAPAAVINPQPAPAAKKAAPAPQKSRAQAPVQLAPPKESDDN
jgi:hypothetical protein